MPTLTASQLEGNKPQLVAGLVAGTANEYQVLKVNADGSLSGVGGNVEPSPVALGSISGAVTLNRTSGQQQNATATGNVIVNVSNGSDWHALDFWLIASSADRTLDLHAAIQKPSDSAISFPVTITSGKGCRVKFEKHGSTWMLVSLVKSYTL